MLNIEIPIFITPLNEGDRDLIGKVDKIRKKRNGVIHEGDIIVEEDARNAIESIQQFVIFLDKHEIPERRRAILSVSSPH